VVDELQQHYIEGRLDSDELSERIARAMAARTFGELREPLADLPALQPAPEPSRSAHAFAWPRVDPALTALLLLVGSLVVVWLFWLPGSHMNAAGFLPMLIVGGFFFSGGPHRRRRR
jgi:hypothetical protein